MLESTIERRMCQALKSRGAIPVKMQDSVSGLPDRVVLLPGGRVVWVELKQEHGRLSEIQKKMIERLRALGHEVHVVYGMEQAMALVEEVMPDEV